MKRLVWIALLCIGSSPFFSASAQEVNVDQGAVDTARSAFVERMVDEHGFDRAAVAEILDSASINRDVLRAISRPAERVVPWYDYRQIFLTPARIQGGVDFWLANADSIERVARETGVEASMIVAIIGVETLFGQRMGNYRVLDSLSTLAFAYPPRATFFAGELEAFLLMSKEEGPEVLDALGSYAGAMGAGQFIPTSFRAYAVDGDGDGRRDLWANWDDILASVANYFRRHGWRTGEPIAVPAGYSGSSPLSSSRGLELDTTVGSLVGRGLTPEADLPPDTKAMLVALEGSPETTEYWVGLHNFRVITRYNRSDKYALAAFQLAEAIRAAHAQSVDAAAGRGSPVASLGDRR